MKTGWPIAAALVIAVLAVIVPSTLDLDSGDAALPTTPRVTTPSDSGQPDAPRTIGSTPFSPPAAAGQSAEPAIAAVADALELEPAQRATLAGMFREKATRGEELAARIRNLQPIADSAALRELMNVLREHADTADRSLRRLLTPEQLQRYERNGRLHSLALLLPTR